MDHLKGKTRILVTHQLQFLPYADCVVVMENGQIKVRNTPNPNYFYFITFILFFIIFNIFFYSFNFNFNFILFLFNIFLIFLLYFNVLIFLIFFLLFSYYFHSILELIKN